MNNKAFWISVGFCLLLVVSNIWWMFNLFDAGVTLKYQGETLKDNKMAVDQLLDVVSALSKDEASKEEIVDAAKISSPGSTVIEKDGFIYIGGIGLKFSDDDKLIEAKRSWSYPGT